MRPLWIVAVAVAFSPLLAHAQEPPAQPTPPVLVEVYACANVADEAQRLSCYDTAVGRLREAEAQGRLVTVDREQVATIQRESFGFRLPSLTNLIGRNDRDPQVDNMEMQVVRIRGRSDGRYSFVMSNGQTWGQTESQSISNVQVGDTVSIRRAALGSFLLSTEHGRAHRVRREE